jgi:hypothetical protein
LLDYRDAGIALVCRAKNQFVLGIVLEAETGKVFIGSRVEPANWLEVAYRRTEIEIFAGAIAGLPEIAGGAINCQNIIDKGNCGYEKDSVLQKVCRHDTLFPNRVRQGELDSPIATTFQS